MQVEQSAHMLLLHQVLLRRKYNSNLFFIQATLRKPQKKKKKKKKGTLTRSLCNYGQNPPLQMFCKIDLLKNCAKAHRYICDEVFF